MSISEMYVFDNDRFVTYDGVMLTTVLFDGDGILVNKPFQFSDRFSKEYGVPMEKLLAFFENDFQPCLVGEADLKEVLQPYLAAWGYQITVPPLSGVVTYGRTFDEARAMARDAIECTVEV